MLHLLAVSTLALIDQGSAGQNVVATQISTVEGAGSPVAGWVKGAVCADVTDSTDARDMLRGKHIVASEMWWMPYAKGPGMDTKSGWAGLNIDMLTRFSEILGFTFEIRDMGYPTSEYTYTDLLREQVEYADLTMSWWVAQRSPRTSLPSALATHCIAPWDSVYMHRVCVCCVAVGHAQVDPLG